MTGFVYAIGDGEGRVKIGWSANPLSRLIKIRSDCAGSVSLLGTIEATRGQEREAHFLLARWRVAGEWFRLEGAVAAFVAMLQKPGPRAVKVATIADDAHPLERFRRERGMTLKTFAKQLGITHATLSRIENRKLQVSPRIIRQASDVTGIPPRELRPDIWEALYGRDGEPDEDAAA